MTQPSDLAGAETLAAGEHATVQLVPPPGDGEERYRAEGELGKGGMGVVSLRFDRRIGRRVAAKQLRPDLLRDGQSQARFLREAQVQAQLEHPSIVPVYDMGIHADGTPFFTMKTIRGVTLREILERLRAGDPEAVARYTPHRLLGTLASVCLAVDYAHRRGILHRDLKPANLMLGDFGEVYVLDWGLAKITGAPDVDRSLSPDTPSPTAMTHLGALLGSPGYMAPEQIDRPSDVTPAADVYALGAILFELLALEPLHPRTSVAQVIDSTRRGADARPSVRAPQRDVAPELEVVCERATQLDPAARFPSVRELHDAIQHYLEGERDQELRRDKAAVHARAAAAAAERMREPGAAGLDARRAAMQEVGRAQALDPGSTDAVATMVKLLTEPPDETPPEVSYEIEKGFRRRSRWVGGVGAVVYPAVLCFLPLMLWMGVLDPVVTGVFFGLLAVSGAISILVMKSRVPPLGAILVAMLTSCAAFALASRFTSPLVLAPTALAVNAAGYAVFLDRRYRLLVTAVASLAVAVPIALEATGAVPATFVFRDGGLWIRSAALELPAGPTLAMVVGGSVAGMVLCTLVVGHIRDQLADAERRMYLYTWHLRELVPAGARRATDPTAS